jgi:hypothetical protein
MVNERKQKMIHRDHVPAKHSQGVVPLGLQTDSYTKDLTLRGKCKRGPRSNVCVSAQVYFL